MKQATLLVLFLQIFSGIIYAQSNNPCESIVKYGREEASEYERVVEMHKSIDYYEGKSTQDNSIGISFKGLGTDMKQNVFRDIKREKKRFSYKSYEKNVKNSKLGDKVVEAWSTCISGQEVSIWAESLGDETYRIHIRYGTNANSSGKIRYWKINNGKPVFPKDTEKERIGSDIQPKTDFLVTRNKSSKAIFFALEIESPETGRSFTKTLYIPAKPVPPITDTYQKDLTIRHNIISPETFKNDTDNEQTLIVAYATSSSNRNRETGGSADHPNIYLVNNSTGEEKKITNADKYYNRYESIRVTLKPGESCTLKGKVTIDPSIAKGKVYAIQLNN